MDILIIAPSLGIENVNDWVASASGNKITVLNGTVTIREALSHIASGKYQIVHFATHGCVSALTMSDGAIDIHLIEDAFRAAGNVECVILSACASVAIGAAIYRGGVPRVLAWRADVEDKIAGIWAKTFYASIQMGRSIWDAARTAAEVIENLGAEPPIFLNGRLSQMQAELQELRSRGKSLPKWLLHLLMAYGVMQVVLLLLIVLR